jgi:hypothetical protein
MRLHTGFVLGRIASELRAARAFHHAQAASHSRHALAGTLKGEEFSTQGSPMGIWVATASRHPR